MLQEFTERLGYLVYGAYNAAAVIVLLNMLIAMMSRSFDSIQVNHTCPCIQREHLRQTVLFYLPESLLSVRQQIKCSVLALDAASH